MLIVDRDTRYAEWLRHHLGVLWPDARVSVKSLEAFESDRDAVTHRECDLLMLAASFGSSPEDPEAVGLELLRRLRSSSCPAVIAVAEEGNELTAVRALQLGAVDYLPKRLITPERLKTAVKLALRRIERRVARRLAGLAQTTSTPSRKKPAPANVPEDPAAALRNLIPGYAIRTTIGESEKAVVYVATSLALEREIALKISKNPRDEADEWQFLSREYTAIANIHHTGVVEIYDYGIQRGHEYLAMEYFPRGDLKGRLQQGIAEQDAVHYLEQIATALRVVHNAGILHRDLKPPNVMLRENDEIALIDFGLARNVEGAIQSTRTGVLRGSPYYMSPEQALGEPLDARTDLYSLGIIFYEMLTGRKPYTGGSAMDVLQQHVNAPVPELPETLAHYQPLLTRLLAKSRDERLASAEELLRALDPAPEEVQEPESSAA